jgi:hypothetical protein
MYRMGRDNVVSIVTRYGPDGPGIKSWWSVRFSAPIQAGSGAHPASYTMRTRSFLGVVCPGHGVDHWSPSSAEVKERVELYLYSPSGPSWPVLGWTLPLLYLLPKCRILNCVPQCENIFVIGDCSSHVTMFQTAVVHDDGNDHCVQNHNFYRTLLFVFQWCKSLCSTVAVRKVNCTRFFLVAVMVLHHVKGVFVLTDNCKFCILLLDQFKI